MIPAGRILWSSESDDILRCEVLIALRSLIFLGSKNYPYKGVLDHLANRAGSNGTNAWTANDRELGSQYLPWPMANFGLDTAYTIATAGSEGFLNMLPSKPYSV
jgi:Zn-dependent M16 (insulinase) family peptidase